MKSIQSQAGFTLIETIIYIALLVMLMGGVVLATFNMISSSDQSQYKALMQNEGQFMIAKFHSVLNNATSVSVSGTTLTAQYPAGANKVLDLNSSKLRLDGTPLNGDIAPVTALAFTPASGTATRPAEVQMTLTISNPYYQETFTAKKLMR